MSFRIKAPNGCELPVCIEAANSRLLLSDSIETLKPAIESYLTTVGGVLFRGYSVPSVEKFQDIARSFGSPLLSYDFGSTPRSSVTSGGVYTSTEYPAHQHIPLHNEKAYTREWPMKIWFHCVQQPKSGGETPIADSRAIYQNIPDAIKNKFADGLLYVRNYGDFGVPWQEVFNTENKNKVEAYCIRSQINFKWQEDGSLRTEQLCQGVEQHPITKEWVWFNQAHLFHESNLQPEVREILVDTYGARGLPRNVFWADGSEIEDSVLNEVRNVLDDQTVLFPWQNGDVLMLDNMLVAHARRPFEGPRKIVVAMAEAKDNFPC